MIILHIIPGEIHLVWFEYLWQILLSTLQLFGKKPTVVVVCKGTESCETRRYGSLFPEFLLLHILTKQYFITRDDDPAILLEVEDLRCLWPQGSCHWLSSSWEPISPPFVSLSLCLLKNERVSTRPSPDSFRAAFQWWSCCNSSGFMEVLHTSPRRAMCTLLWVKEEPTTLSPLHLLNPACPRNPVA